MQTYRIIAASLMLAAVVLPTVAQSEGGLIMSVEVQKSLDKQWSVGLEADMRTRNNFQTMDRWKVGVGASYKITKGLKADVGYLMMYTNFREDIKYKESGAYNKWLPSYWGPRHRIYAALTGSHKFQNNIKVALRERWQWTYRTEHEGQLWDFDDAQWEDNVRDGKGKHQLRSRLEVSYDKKKALLVPFASVELYNSWAIEKVRYTVGTDIQLTKHHGFQLFYRHQHMHNTSAQSYDPHMNYIGVGYKLKW